MNRRSKAGAKTVSSIPDTGMSKSTRVTRIKKVKEEPSDASLPKDAVKASKKMTRKKVEQDASNQSPLHAKKPVITKRQRKIKEEPESGIKSSQIKTRVKRTIIKQESAETPNEPLSEEPLSKKKIKLEKLPQEHNTASPNKTFEIKKEPGSRKYIGAHVSISGGLENAVTNALAIGARAFGLFLTSQRTWASKPLEVKAAAKFQEACARHGFEPRFILPHGSYLLNCGAPNPETLEKSRLKLVDELRRCEMLGLELYNFHPGSTCGEISVEKCITNISQSINQALDQTKGVTAVIENMSCQGNTIGGKFSELQAIIDGVEDKSRVGICLDTCHAFAAGYDVSTKSGFDATMEEFDSVIGLSYLKAVHLNDSVGKLGCHLDRHENIGRGFIGKKGGFVHIMNDPRLDNIPLILETPANLSDEEEIKILYSYVK